MKKILTLTLSFVALVSMTILIGFLSFTQKVGATNPQPSVEISETKYMISNDGQRMLLISAINNYNLAYEVGYTIPKYTNMSDVDTNQTKVYYSSITISGNKQLPADIFGSNYESAKFIIWEIGYIEDASFKAYVKEGYIENGALYKYEPEKIVENAERVNTKYTVTYYDENDVLLHTEKLHNGETPTYTITKEEADGYTYTFNGWDKAFAPITANTQYKSQGFTKTAKTDTPYKVEHYQQNLADDGYTLFESEDKTGTTDTKTNAVAKSYTGYEANSFEQVNIDGTGNAVVVIRYDRKLYTVTLFDENKNQYDTLTNIKYGTTAQSLYDLDTTKTGYTFAGWYVFADNQVGVKVEPNHTIADNVSVIKQYTANTYAITYEGVEASEHSNPDTYTIEDDITFAAAARAGYTFGGWTPASIARGSTGDKTVTATWIANTDTPYSIKVYQQTFIQKMESDPLYEDITAEAPFETNRKGTTDTLATLPDNLSTYIPAGYVFDETQSVVSGNIAGDGSLVLKVYLKFDMVDFFGTSMENAKIGSAWYNISGDTTNLQNGKTIISIVARDDQGSQKFEYNEFIPAVKPDSASYYAWDFYSHRKEQYVGVAGNRFGLTEGKNTLYFTWEQLTANGDATKQSVTFMVYSGETALSFGAPVAVNEDLALPTFCGNKYTSTDIVLPEQGALKVNTTDLYNGKATIDFVRNAESGNPAGRFSLAKLVEGLDYDEYIIEVLFNVDYRHIVFCGKSYASEPSKQGKWHTITLTKEALGGSTNDNTAFCFFATVGYGQAAIRIGSVEGKYVSPNATFCGTEYTSANLTKTGATNFAVLTDNRYDDYNGKATIDITGQTNYGNQGVTVSFASLITEDMTYKTYTVEIYMSYATAELWGTTEFRNTLNQWITITVSADDMKTKGIYFYIANLGQGMIPLCRIGSVTGNV